MDEPRLSSIDSARRRVAHSSSSAVLSRSIRRIAIANNLLTRKPPSLAVFFRKQRLLIPFGSLGGVGHVGVSFLKALHDAVHGLALRVALLVELGQRIVKHGLGVDEPTFEDCQVPDLRTALFRFWVMASDFRVNAVCARRTGGVSMQSSPLITIQCLQLAIALQNQSSVIKSRADTTTVGLTRGHERNSPSSFAYGIPRMTEDSAVAHLPKRSRGISRTVVWGPFTWYSRNSTYGVIIDLGECLRRV
jgi:hypothetical protein